MGVRKIFPADRALYKIFSKMASTWRQFQHGYHVKMASTHVVISFPKFLRKPYFTGIESVFIYFSLTFNVFHLRSKN